jgi:hypothetical protein
LGLPLALLTRNGLTLKRGNNMKKYSFGTFALLSGILLSGAGAQANSCNIVTIYISSHTTIQQGIAQALNEQAIHMIGCSPVAHGPATVTPETNGLISLSQPVCCE